METAARESGRFFASTDVTFDTNLPRYMAHQHKDKWYRQHKELSTLIRDWDLIPGCPSDEFAGVSFKLLSALQRGESFETIARLLESELTITFGFYSDELDIDKWIVEVGNWWSKQ